ncbi:MAG TPA: carboxypeptidase-like regulatory domain-containing protein, partial [Iamia sp.]|nr:carboxypeptidase-like regulatory domain-containing protein [Iamia sp.]
DGVGFSTTYFDDTDSLGGFDLGEVPDGEYRVVFTDPAQDYVTEWWDGSLLRSTSTEITFTDDAVMILDAGLATGAEIDVSITNPGTYTVALYNSGPVGVSAFRSIPGVDEGSVALRGLPGGTYYVSVTDPAGALVEKWSGNQTVRADAAPITLATGATTSEAFTLVAPNTISGTITDSEGPVPMVTVQAYNASSGAYVKAGKTDELGEYAIKGVPAGQYKVVFRDASGAHPVTWFGGGEAIGSATPITMSNGGALTADEEIPRAATVTGAVTGGPGGLTPLVGAKVTLYRNGAAVKTYLTDATGTYTATGLSAGSYTVLFVATGHRSEYSDDKPRKADADAIAVDPGVTVEADATLTPA